MKNYIILTIAFLCFTLTTTAQIKLSDLEAGQTYQFIMQDGTEFVGEIKEQNSSEITITTIKLGDITFPKYKLNSINAFDPDKISAKGELIHEQTFATRYFITTNGLPIKKGDSYALINWYGPDIHFGVADNFSLGLMTTWLASPIVGSFKYSNQIDDKRSYAIGVLAGSLGWTGVDYGGVLPFAAFTYGDRVDNITFSAGYGAVWYPGFSNIGSQTTEVDGEALISIAGMKSLSNTLSLIFDSFIVPGLADETPFTAILIPGLRFQRKDFFAIQFGFTGIYTDLDAGFGDSPGYGFVPFPLPMAQIYFKF